MVNRRDTLKIAAGAALGTHFASSIALAQDDQVPDGFFLAPATGGQEVPPLDTEAQGGAVFALNEDGSAMDYALAVQGIVDVNQAHIHQGPAGENGEVVVWLYPGPATQEPQTISGRFDGVLAQGTIESDDLTGPLEGESLDALLQAMAEDDAYVNVHTEANPPGEIRGQIVTVDDVVEALDLEAAAAETATETPGVETETETPAAETETETPAAETETETPAAETETETPEGAIDSEGN